jgi:hypothetical protein
VAVRQTLVPLLLALLLTACSAPGTSDRQPAGPRLSHDVYFTLKDNTPEMRAALVRDCLGLRSLNGVLALWVGPRAEEFDRPTNDHEFDMALHVLFRDRAAHDLYQVSTAHQALLSTWMERFESVRVFDSWVVGF